MELRDARIVLTILLAGRSTGCGSGPDRTGAADASDGQVAIAGRPSPVGWQEIVLPAGPPEAAAVDDGGAWAAFEGGGAPPVAGLEAVVTGPVPAPYRIIQWNEFPSLDVDG